MIKSPFFAQLLRVFQSINVKKTLPIESFHIDAKCAGVDERRNRLIIADQNTSLSLGSIAINAMGRDNFGFYLLAGPLPNVLNQSADKTLANKDITNLISLMGLKHQVKYTLESSFKSLRYQSVLLLSNVDTNGIYTKAALINMFNYFWLNILKHHFIKELILPE